VLGGLNISYAVLDTPAGLAQAFVIGMEFVGRDLCSLVLGYKIFFGHSIRDDLTRAADRAVGATAFGYRVSDPENYGVVDFDRSGKAISLEEKPKQPKSNYAVTGLYFYDNQVVDIATSIKPSWRGELEITDVNCHYLDKGQLHVERLGRGYAWFDAGTHESLLNAGEFVRTIQRRQGFQIACPEEIAYRLGYIDAEQLGRLAEPLMKTEYGAYLQQVMQDQGPLDWADLYQ
jgi:glucose-1-phosphate thymidylyltransferase